MPQIDLKLVAVAALILGLFSGFYVDNTLLSKPRITSLTETITEQESTISDLESQLDTLQDDYDDLESQFTFLQENNVPLSEHVSLQEDYDDQVAQIATLQDQVESQQSSIAAYEDNVDSLEDALADLQNEYDRLEVRYIDAYNPLYTAFTVNNLKFNLTTNTDIYPENTEITGKVTIKYTTGGSFTGTFKLSIYKVYVNSGTSSEVYTITGSKNYTWSNPFVLGSGSYKLSLTEVKDSGGNYAVSNTDLRSHVVYIFVG